MFNRQYFSFYCLIVIFFLNCIFCTTYDNAYFSDFKDSKAVSIDSEEIIRRRSIAENYLKENNNPETAWVETYHHSFSERSFISKKNLQESSLKNEQRVYVTLPFQNEELSSLRNSDNSVHPHETLFTRKNLGDSNKDEVESTKTGRNKIQQEFLKSDKNGNENHVLTRSDYDAPSKSHVSKGIFETNDNVVPKSGKQHSKFRSKSNKLRKNLTDCDMFKDNKLDPTMECFCKTKRDDLRLNELKTLSLDAEKTIQITIKNTEFTSKKYFIHGETLTLTEFNKLQEYLSSLSFLQKSKNNVYSINRMKIVDLIGKITPSYKQDKCSKENQKQSCKFSEIGNDITAKTFDSEGNNIKQSELNFKSRVGHLERTDRSYLFHDSEILRRKNLMNTFINTLSNNHENWVETYHLNDIKTHNKNTFNLQKTEEQNNESFKIHSQERFYIIRWINKLQNKLKDHHTEYHSLSISVSSDLYKILGKLSQEFDIVMFDELVNNIIANATLYNYANTLYFNHENILNMIYLTLNCPTIYILITLLFCYFFIYNLHCTNGLNFNFTLYRVMLTFVKHYKWILLIIFVGFSFYLTGYKMYQQKVAEKHSVISRVVPSYCESILNKESGVVAHIQEWFRLYWHDEDCRKYYEAIMVDPSSEITFFSISIDLLSDAIFQMLQPLARNMNSFYKTLTYDLSFVQRIFLVIVTIFIVILFFYNALSFLAFFRNYRVNFPFHLGSVEPTVFCKGSRVEEIEEKDISPSYDFSTNCDTSQIDYYDKAKSKNYIEQVFKENFLKIGPKFKLEPLKQSAPKASRTRCHSI